MSTDTAHAYEQAIDSIAQRLERWDEQASKAYISETEISAIVAHRIEDIESALNLARVLKHVAFAFRVYPDAAISRQCSIGGKIEDEIKDLARELIRADLERALEELTPIGDPNAQKAASLGQHLSVAL